MSNYHVSVLLNEAIENLAIKPDGIYLDLTLGRAGHSSEILRKLSARGRLIAFDKDIEAINFSKEKLSSISSNFTLIKDDFRNFKSHLNEMGISHVDGILLDLGVSSPQFDDISRGFSYKGDAKLDMRMDQTATLDAYTVINTYSLPHLTQIFREYGEDKYAYNVAKNILKYRESKPIESTSELVEIIKSSKPQKELAKKGHPAKQIFQAIRIEVNDELGALKAVLSDALESLNVGGRLAIISFHSLEDRIVKVAFKNAAVIEGSRDPLLALNTQEPDYKLVNNHVILPSEEELAVNPRSKSAKMRVIERIKQ